MPTSAAPPLVTGADGALVLATNLTEFCADVLLKGMYVWAMTSREGDTPSQ